MWLKNLWMSQQNISLNTKMLTKATTTEINVFQAFTIRNLDNKFSTTSDVELYKVLSVREEPIDNRQQHLDVMCFPVLFPNMYCGSSQQVCIIC